MSSVLSVSVVELLVSVWTKHSKIFPVDLCILIFEFTKADLIYIIEFYSISSNQRKLLKLDLDNVLEPSITTLANEPIDGPKIILKYLTNTRLQSLNLPKSQIIKDGLSLTSTALIGVSNKTNSIYGQIINENIIHDSFKGEGQDSSLTEWSLPMIKGTDKIYLEYDNLIYAKYNGLIASLIKTKPSQLILQNYNVFESNIYKMLINNKWQNLPNNETNHGYKAIYSLYQDSTRLLCVGGSRNSNQSGIGTKCVSLLDLRKIINNNLDNLKWTNVCNFHSRMEYKTKSKLINWERENKIILFNSKIMYSYDFYKNTWQELPSIMDGSKYFNDSLVGSIEYNISPFILSSHGVIFILGEKDMSTYTYSKDSPSKIVMQYYDTRDNKNRFITLNDNISLKQYQSDKTAHSVFCQRL